MSYYKPYYKKKYYHKNYSPNIFDMLADIIVALGTLFGMFVFLLFKKIFDNRNKIKGLFKLNETSSDTPEINTQIQNNINQISGSENELPAQEKVDKKYSLKESQVTEAERDFLEILKQIVGDRYRIEPQVQLSSIIRPIDSNGRYTNYTDFNKIKAKSIDFVLFDNTNKPYLAIELDDRSHFRWDRIKRDQFVNDLMNEVGLRIIHVKVSYSYDIDKLRKQIFIN